MYKQIILSHLMKYLELKNIPIKRSGPVIMMECPLCHHQKISANKIPNTYIVNCFACKRKYTLIDIARAVDKVEGTDEEVLQYLKNILDIDIKTKIDEENLEQYLDYYVENGFSLVPIKVNDKIPIEKDWPSKEHRDKEEWKSWLVNKLNVGINCGLSKVTIIDIDQKPIPNEMVNLMGTTLMQESGNGFHLIYQEVPELPKTRIESLKIDIENAGGQVVIFPSIVNGIQRKIEKLVPIAAMPEELKKYLLDKVTIPRQTQSEKVREDIQTESFNLGVLGEGIRSNSLTRLGGVFRKFLPPNKTGEVLNVLNKTLCKEPLTSQEMRAMIGSLEKYNLFDEKELAHKIVEYLKILESASKAEIEIAVLGERPKGEAKKKFDNTLTYLIREERIIKKGREYQVIREMDWSGDLINTGVPVDFEVPYFHDWAYLNKQDLIILGSRTKFGKTTLAMNFVKRLCDQNLNPDYIYNETGGRFAKTALTLGLKENDFYHAFCADPDKVILRKNKVTIFDWVKPNDFARTDNLFSNLVEKVKKTNGFLICFVQLRNDNNFFAKDQIGQFPSILARYLYEDENCGTNTKFVLDFVREAKVKGKSFSIPCIYDWMKKTVRMVEETQLEKEEK